MLDINYIRDNQAKVLSAIKNKGYEGEIDLENILSLDDSRRKLSAELDELRRKRNEISSLTKNGKPDRALIEQGKELKSKISEKEKVLLEVKNNFISELKKVPNIPTDDVPIGLSEDENIVAETCGEPTTFDFKPKNHYEIGTIRDWIDKERAAKISGARFAYIKGELVQLQMAIVNWVMNTLSDEEKIKEIVKKNNLNVSTKPFKLVLPPLMLRTKAYDEMDRLEPREDRYKIEGEDLWLQGSAEHVIGSMHSGEILPEKLLPLRYLGYATSFRQEAGTYGKDMEGIIRMHQFDKMEMESFTTKDTSLNEHFLFVAIQRYLVEQLELPYRVIQKCTYDIGKPDARGIDIEIWLPGQNKYRETHTADYMTDYQTRRTETKVRREDGSIEFTHTNDATAFALGRIMIAIIENYQNENCTIKIPKVLRPYLNNKEEL